MNTEINSKSTKEYLNSIEDYKDSNHKAAVKREIIKAINNNLQTVDNDLRNSSVILSRSDLAAIVNKYKLSDQALKLVIEILEERGYAIEVIKNGDELDSYRLTKVEAVSTTTTDTIDKVGYRDPYHRLRVAKKMSKALSNHGFMVDGERTLTREELAHIVGRIKLSNAAIDIALEVLINSGYKVEVNGDGSVLDTYTITSGGSTPIVEPVNSPTSSIIHIVKDKDVFEVDTTGCMVIIMSSLVEEGRWLIHTPDGTMSSVDHSIGVNIMKDALDNDADEFYRYDSDISYKGRDYANVHVRVIPIDVDTIKSTFTHTVRPFDLGITYTASDKITVATLELVDVNRIEVIGNGGARLDFAYGDRIFGNEVIELNDVSINEMTISKHTINIAMEDINNCKVRIHVTPRKHQGVPDLYQTEWV